jgi:hypothetical protein
VLGQYGKRLTVRMDFISAWVIVGPNLHHRRRPHYMNAQCMARLARVKNH